MSTSQRAVMPCDWGVKAGTVRVWVTGNTVRSPCYTEAICECFRDKEPIYKALYKFLRLLYFFYKLAHGFVVCCPSYNQMLISNFSSLLECQLHWVSQLLLVCLRLSVCMKSNKILITHWRNLVRTFLRWNLKVTKFWQFWKLWKTSV